MDDKYKRELIDSVDELCAKVETCGSARKLVTEFVDGDDESAAVELLRMLSLDPRKKDPESVKAVRAVHDALLSYCGYRYLRKSFDSIAATENDARTLPELLAELDSLVGLEDVKRKVRDLIAYQRVLRLRREKGFVSDKGTLHLAFTGNPGTGKTTVARIVGRIYRQIGLLSKGHFVEVSRTDLIAGYQGQTALKVKKVIERSRGGVLFIDEAYSITENDHCDSYGRECLTELTKALEDCRNDLVVIVAGYTKPMEKFFESNPGLKSRFNTFIEFPDYNSEDLVRIFRRICKQNDYVATDALIEAVRKFFNKRAIAEKENFSNGRFARNLFEDIVMNHARRCAEIQSPTAEELTELLEKDLDEVRVI